MPIYEFHCPKCSHDYEELVPRMGDKAPCPECGSKKVNLRLSAPAAPRSTAPDLPPCGEGCCRMPGNGPACPMSG